MNTPAAEPLVPPSGGRPQQPAAPPAPPGYGQQPGCAAQSAYAAPSWPFRPGGALSGVTVASAVENALYDDGSDVEGVNCPDTAAAQVSTVVACTGTFDGDDWALIVYLLDEEGSILVTSY